MESLARLFEGLLKLLSHWFAYDHGATKKENQQLKENAKLRDEYEKIDNSNVSIDDALDEWVRKNV